MASSAQRQQDYFRLSWDTYRLTSDGHGYEVLSAILVLSVSCGRPDTNCIPLQGLINATQELRERDARLYGLQIPPAISAGEVLDELHNLDARGVIASDFLREDHVIVEPLIRYWHGLPSVRVGTDGELVRRIP